MPVRAALLRGGRAAGAAQMHGRGLRGLNAGADDHALGSPAPVPLLDLGKGWPSFGLMPHAAVAAAAQRATTPASLHYAPAQGHTRFREAVAALLNAELRLVGGREVLPDNLMLTSGASTGLALAAMAARPRPGDVCLVETGTYWFAHRVLLDGGFALDTVAQISDGGLDLEDLERQVAKPRVKALYLVPTFSNPRGTTIPASQRREIVRLCRQHGVVVFADEGPLPAFAQTCCSSSPAGCSLVMPHFSFLAVYDFLRWTTPHAAPPEQPPGLALFDEDGSTVLSLGSFTKLLGPGLRLGWIQVGGRGARSPILEQILALGCVRGGGSINAWVGAVCTDLVESGVLSQHIRMLRQVLL